MKRIISGSWRRKRRNRKERRMNVSEVGGRGRSGGVKRKELSGDGAGRGGEEEVK
jgi:hypothetical protein